MSILDLPQPIIGLAPMDGVSDAAFRQITKKYGNPDIMFTEFTHVRALAEAAQNVLREFEFAEMERPIVAQIYGTRPNDFYHAAKIVCALGFDGVDINMGCPAKNVASSGAGAALIKTPDLALEIIQETKWGVADWVANGKITGLRKKSQEAVEKMTERNKNRIAENTQTQALNSLGFQNLAVNKRSAIPVTVKTRIGFDEMITETWVQTLEKAKPGWIAMHGRTLKQMYSGGADWDELKKAVEATDLPVLTNGDIKTHEDIQKMLAHTGSAGVLIGRASFGNPWVFNPLSPQVGSLSLKKGGGDVLLEHCKLFAKHNPDPRAFVQMRKHLGWYVKGFENAKELRNLLVRASSVEEVEEIVKSYTTKLSMA